MRPTPDATVADLTDRARPAVFYLAHDLDDSAIWRRVAMLERGGAEVAVAGFRRGTGPVGGKTGGLVAARARPLGQTRNGQFAMRLLLVARIGLATLFGRGLADVARPDLILARNLEMLALAMLLRLRFGAVPVVYELLDVHRIMLGASLKSRAVRAVERAMLRRSALVIVSSDGFTDNYLTPAQGAVAPVLLVENKPLAFLLPDTAPMPRVAPPGGPLVIGWFGILRCGWSLDCLDRLTRAHPGRFRVVLRGKPALDVLPRFHDTVAANPDLRFDGPYAWPEDLAQIYGAVDLAWLIDRYDAGANSDWLLPNRLYEGAAHGAVPIVLKATAVADRVARAGFGIEVMFPRLDAVEERLLALTDPDLTRARAALAALPRATWVAEDAECAGVVARLGALAVAPGKTVARPASTVSWGGADSRVLIVIPTLNEAAHIGRLLHELLPFAASCKASIVVADGGSDDGTQGIVREIAAQQPQIHLLDNPDRLQSAGINRAVQAFGADCDWLIRIDAHASYPADYCQTLLDEAARTSADSVVVAMEAVGQTRLQSTIATAQNSRLGNGGSAHRMGGQGRWVNHGHHALMRMAAFRSVGGYDAGFSHNEDAELDHRLQAAGFRIWLTAATRLIYYPRSTLSGLMRQYFRFGKGRARNLIKHQMRPALRQGIVALLLPAMLLGVLAIWSTVFLLPLALWVAGCLAGGLMIGLSQTQDMAALSLPQRLARGLGAGFVAGTMHLAWSAGFWTQVLEQRTTLRGRANA